MLRGMGDDGTAVGDELLGVPLPFGLFCLQAENLKGGGGGTSFDGPVYPGRPGGSGAGGTSRPPSAGGSATQPGTTSPGTDYGNAGGSNKIFGATANGTVNTNNAAFTIV